MRHVLICSLASLALLTACSPANNTAVAMHLPYSPLTGLVVLDGISVINTDKTVEDHVISWATGQDCSLVRASMGEHYCVDETPVPKEPRTTYCYRSIAVVSCYDRQLASDESRYYGARMDLVPVQVK
jgi:hypothetical protein